MIKEAIDRLLQLAKPEELTLQGRPYTTAAVHAVTEPIPAAIEVQSLAGLKHLIEGGLNAVKKKDVFLLVQTHKTVQLCGLSVDAWGKRTYHIKAEACLTGPFTFGRFLPAEEFAIGLMAKFAGTEDRDLLVQLVANLTAEAVTNSEDDGVTQRVAVKRGISFKQGVTVKPRHKLAPFRTFSEVEQPASEFLLRLKQEEAGEIPHVGLFEADGGAWQITAMQNIKTWLESNIPGVTVVA